MNDPKEHQALMKEGIWKLCLDKDNIDEALQSFEQHEVTTAVDLILKTSDPSNFRLTHIQALRLIRLVTSRRDSIVWHELFLEVASESPHWQYCVCHIADCFPTISVSMALSSHHLPLATCFAIQTALQQDNRLQELSLNHFVLSDDTMNILSQAIRSPSTLSLKRLSLSNVDYVPSREENDRTTSSENHPLAAALAQNTTLKRIEIRDCMTSNQETLLEMMNALIGFTSLEELSLEGLNLAATIRLEQDDTNLMASLTKMVVDPKCQIRTLDVNICGFGQRQALQSLLSSLEQNNTIESIDLSENGFDSLDMTMVLDCIKKMPSIRHVDLNDQVDLEERSISWLENSCLLEAQPTSHLVELQIDDYLPDTGDFDYDSENSEESDDPKAEIESILLKLLRNNPSLGNFGIEVAETKDRLPPSVCRLLDLNLCGRRLLMPTLTSQPETCDSTFAADDIPLGLWPIVLERANALLSRFPQRNASVLFHFLQNGQFLMNR